MATRNPDGPSAHTILSQTPGGLSSPHPEITASLGTYVHPSEAAHVSAEHPALRQDFGSVHDQHASLTTTFDIDEPDFSFWTDDSWSLPNIGLEQIWVLNPGLQSEQACDPTLLEASPCEYSQITTELIGAKRTVSSPPPSDFVHKRRKVTHETLTSPHLEQSAPLGYDQRAERLMTDQQLLETLHTSARPPEPPPTTPAMTEEVQKLKRSLLCPSRRAQAKLGLPYTCTAAPVTTVSAVRTHLSRKLPKGKPPHLPFLKLCKTCNEDILDKQEFEASHGKDGLKCETPRQQRKGDAGQQEQYDILCAKVEAYIVTKRNQAVTITSDTGEHDATLLRPTLSTSDSVLASRLSAPSQAQDAITQDTITREHHSPPIRSDRSPPSHMAKQNPIEGDEWSWMSMELDTHTADRYSAVDKRVKPTTDSANHTPTVSEGSRYTAVPQDASPQTSHLVDETVQPSGAQEEVELQIFGDSMEHDEHEEVAQYNWRIWNEYKNGLSSNAYSDRYRNFQHATGLAGSWSPYPSLIDIASSDSATGDTLRGTAAHTSAPTNPSQFTLRPMKEVLFGSVNLPLVHPNETRFRTATQPLYSWTPYNPPITVIPSVPVSGSSRRLSISSTTTPPSEPSTVSSSTVPDDLHCDAEGCNASFRGLYRKGNLARHKRHNHPGSRLYTCEDGACGKTFKRQDARLKHYRHAHPRLGSLHMPRKTARSMGGELDVDMSSVPTAKTTSGDPDIAMSNVPD